MAVAVPFRVGMATEATSFVLAPTPATWIRKVDLSQPRSSPCGRSWQQECGGESGGITCAGAPRVAPHAHGLVRMDFLRSRAAETRAGMPRENDGGLALAGRSSVPKVRHQAPTFIFIRCLRSRAAETSAGMPRENDGGLASAGRSSVPKVRHQAPTSILYSMMRIMFRTSTETSVPDDMFLC